MLHSFARTVARPMVAAMFVAGGLDSLRHPAAKAGAAEDVAQPIAGAVGVDTDTTKLVQVNGAVQVAAGAMLAVGVLPKLAATALAGSLVPTTLAGHRFWEADDEHKPMQRIHFLKNVAMLGGLLLLATD